MSVKKIDQVYDQLAAPHDRLVINKPDAVSNHVITGDIMDAQTNQQVADSVIKFLEKVL